MSVERDRPWIMRTYAGHSTARASNELFRANLEKGQTGLSVAFDLPTQTGYDADDPLARGEVGKVGVPVGHLGDMRALLEGIPLDKMNTSMTINATAPWLFGLYVALAEERGIDPAVLEGTTQNDILKEYLSRGTYIFPPSHSLRLSTDLVTYAVRNVPRWNPINVCSYHLQEAGATPSEELAYALVTAIAVLDSVRASGQVSPSEFVSVVGRISFFVNAGIRFVEEMCKMRAFVELWDRITRFRYGIEDAKVRRFRYGVQVNSLGLTEQQPENNIIRIVLEMLAVTLSRDARARAVQLPAWNEALGLPRPWDQQWSLRAQQILAMETDLLEYGDLFTDNAVVQAKVDELTEGAWAEIQDVLAQGGAVEAVESGHIKERLVLSNVRRLREIEAGTRTVIGVNAFREGAPSPLERSASAGAEGSLVLAVDPKVEAEQIESLAAWRKMRDSMRVTRALDVLARAAERGENVMPATVAAARAGATTGEWAHTLRKILGEYRAPTGVQGGGATAVGRRSPVSEPPPSSTHGGNAMDDADALRMEMKRLEKLLGRRPRLLVGKPGLDGHSNGAEQIAIKARDVGFEVIYEGIRSTPAQLVRTAVEEGVHLVGLSILSGSHLALVPDVVNGLREASLTHVPVVVGGIIPDADAEVLRSQGVARVYTPKDFELSAIMRDLIQLIRTHATSGGERGA